MPNNQDLYNGAVAGISGGIQERWIVNSSSDSYNSVRQAIVALATAIDGLIPDVGGVGNDKTRVMQSLCQGIMANRYITSVASSDYAAIAQAIVAYYTEIITAITPVNPPGSVPDDYPTVWVNPLATEGGDGTLAEPFNSLQDAFDFLQVEDMLGQRAVILCFAGALGGLTIDSLGVAGSLTIIGLCGPSTGLSSGTVPPCRVQTVTISSPTLETEQTLQLTNLYIENVIASDVDAELNISATGCHIFGWVTPAAAFSSLEACTLFLSDFRTGVVELLGGCLFQSAVQVNTNGNHLTGDIASVRSMLKTCFLSPTPDGPDAIIINGEGSPTTICGDSDTVVTGPGAKKALMANGTITANRDISLTGTIGTITGFTVDVYTQSDFSVTITDGGLSLTLYTVDPGSAAVRIRAFADGANAVLTNIEPLN